MYWLCQWESKLWFQCDGQRAKTALRIAVHLAQRGCTLGTEQEVCEMSVRVPAVLSVGAGVSQVPSQHRAEG